MKTPDAFLVSLTGKIYKIIPMRDDQEAGKNVFLPEYIDSLLVELLGAIDTYGELRESAYYISIVNTVQYMAHNDMAHSAWRREAFKMLNTVKKLQKQFGGDPDGC